MSFAGKFRKAKLRQNKGSVKSGASRARRKGLVPQTAAWARQVNSRLQSNEDCRERSDGSRLEKKRGRRTGPAFFRGRDGSGGRLILVVFLIARRAIAAADLGIDVHGQQLAAFDQLGVAAYLVRLHVEQEPAVAENVAGVDDTGGLLVLGDEGAVVEKGRVEKFRIVLGYLDELAGIALIEPDFRYPRVVPWIFVHDDAPEGIDGHVVEHAMAFVAVEQDFYGAAFFRILRHVVEAQAPEPAVGADIGRGHEVSVVAVLVVLARVPGAVFRAAETGDVGRLRYILDLTLGEIGNVAEIDQAKTRLADEARGGDAETEEIALLGDHRTVQHDLH